MVGFGLVNDKTIMVTKGNGTIPNKIEREWKSKKTKNKHRKFSFYFFVATTKI
jgi:hypothetical protein